MRVRDIIAGIIFLAFLLWFLGSWAEVMMCSGTGMEHEYCQANMFVLIGEMGK